jgi:hypothetical protein
MRLSLGVAVLVPVFMASGAALAQSINIDFGTPDTIPSHTYAAAARPGAWNSFDSLPVNQRFPLVNLYGQPLPARIYNNGGTALLTHQINGATGGDAALMDDMFLSYNDPTDECIWVEHLLAGTYQVTIYAMTPDDPTLLSRVRVDDGSPGPTMIGGAWPGHHVEGVTYGRFTVSVPADGTIALHSGLYNGFIQSGMNGFQLVRIGDCPADWNGSGAVTSQDFFEFLSDFFAGNGDFNMSGTTDSQDFFDYITAFFAPC